MENNKELKRDIIYLVKELRIKDREVQELAIDVYNLEVANDASSVENKLLNEKVKEVEQENNQLKEVIKEVEQENNNQTTQINKLNSKIKELLNDRDIFNKLKDNFNTLLESALQDKRKLKLENDKLIERIDEIETSNTQLIKEVDRLQDELNELEKY